MADEKNLFYEKDRLRGLVPTSDNGRADLAYETYLNGIEVLDDPDVHIALAAAQDPRFRKFLELISVPQLRLKIQTIAKQCGIDLQEFQNWYGKAAAQMAIAKAQRRAAGIVEDMAKDARSQSEFCDKCEGYGWIPAMAGLPVDTPGYRILVMKTNDKGEEEPIWCRTCPKCKGATRVSVPGDEHSRDRILEIAGLTSKGGKAISIVQNFGGAGHSSAVTSTLGVLTVDVSAEPLDDEGA